jgi:5,10-methylenetetrahydromethanopterin reductase
MTTDLPLLGLTLGHTREDVRRSQQYAVAAERAGLDLIGFGDSQTVFRELYAELTACALATERIAVGSVVTNCVTRVAAVTASAIATVDEISGGRAFLGIGTGQSATANAGVRRGTIEELRSYLRTLRRLHGRSTTPAEDESDPLAASLVWPIGEPPLIVHSSGPRSAAVATELGDGILLRLGDLPPDRLERHISGLRKQFGDAGGDPDTFRVWLYAPGLVCDDPSAAAAEMASLVAARAATVKESTCPPALVERVRKYLAGYDYTRHASAAEPVNARLLDRLGLFDYMVRRYSLVHGHTEMAERLRQLRASGVDAVIFGGAVNDKTQLIESVGELKTAERDHARVSERKDIH